jgi:glycosyltransferase involved in cell wall biosynthesis
MKIIYHHRIRSRDGQSVHLFELIDALRKLGHEVRLVGPGDFTRAEFGHDPALLARAKQLVPRSAYEIAEIGYNIVAYIRLFIACRAFRPDFIYERSNLFLLAGILVKKSMRIPLLLEVNSPLARERMKFGGLALNKVAAWLETWTWRNADCVLPVTDVLAEEVLRNGADANQIAVIPNGIDVNKFSRAVSSSVAKASMGLSGKLVLGFTGFVRPWHGLDAIIDLLARGDLAKNLHFLIVGDGPAIAELKTKSRDLGVADRVTFAGLVQRDAIPRTIAAFDIALLPQCVDYCSPLKIFEYMAAGKAIVAPDQANIREVLTPEFSGLLFAPENRDSMASGIIRLTQDEALRERLGQNAFDEIRSRGYTWQHNAERVSAIGASAARGPMAQSRPAVQ